MRINYLRLLIIIVILGAVLLIVRFVSLDLVLSRNENFIYGNYPIEVLNQDILNKRGNKVGFKFLSVRDNFSKFTVSTLRPNYIFEDNDRKINLAIYYLNDDKKGEKKYSADFPASKLRNFTTFDFPNLNDSKDKYIMVEFTSLEDAEDDRYKVEIVVGDTDPDKRVTTGPRLFYNVRFYDLWSEYLGIASNDSKFFKYYYILVGTIFLAIIILLIVEKKKD
ncbi:MAG: hypothetical protein BWZ03_00456 [bacterium ADurb.BinA186]|nr:MAG: hypothetical protein BWZ03_00456 [bacterium ADurb.BinA186]